MIAVFSMLSFGFILLLLISVNEISTDQNSTTTTTNKTCTVRHGKRLLKEGDEITINTRLYKVEYCILQRAYHACGAHLWVMINIVCEAVAPHKNKIRRRRFTEEKLLIDACCLNICTVHEMTRYCP